MAEEMADMPAEQMQAETAAVQIQSADASVDSLQPLEDEQRELQESPTANQQTETGITTAQALASAETAIEPPVAEAPATATAEAGDGLVQAIVDATLMTKGIPSDPDVMPPGNSQWHLVGTWGLHADQVWGDYTGSGVMIAALDDGFQYTHHEIAPNYRTDLDYDTLGNDTDAAPVGTNNHGTAVIGTIIGDDNGSGTVGVAFDAQGFGIRQGFGAEGNLDDTVEAFQYARTQNVDVMNNSWGYTTAFSDDFNKEFFGTDFYAVENVMIDMVTNGRGGLGQNIVFSAGNARTSGENVNYHNHQNSPYTITVAAIKSDGVVAAFSNPGAALLIAAGGTSVLTTDRTGADGYGSTDYTLFSGTSASAPVVTGMIAVLLEANPDLGWRDVQEILAYSAQHNDAGSAGWQYNGAGNWNGGGLHFSHDYGFGAADLFTAVRLAETWTLQQTSANMTTIAPVSSSPALAIPATGTITTTINIAQNIEIEHVLIDLNISHAKAGDLIITLISPDGTESVLANRPQNGAFTSIYGVTGIDFEMSSNAHWGESSAGTWTLRIEDVVSGNAGTLNSWSLSFMGNAQSANDTYFFTNSFGNFTGAELTARSVITDTDGGTDALNLAAVTSNTTIDLNAGTGMIAGKAVTVAPGTVIENVYGGDGNDILTGNASGNLLYGGRGDDTLTGNGGNDTLDGASGTDTAVYGVSVYDFNYNFVDATTVIMTHLDGFLGTDTLLNIENFTFTEQTYTRAQLETLMTSVPVSQVSLNFVWGGGSYLVNSNTTGTSLYDDVDIGYGGASGDMFSINRTISALVLEYQHADAPGSLTVTGSSDADKIIIRGSVSSLSATINAGDGNDDISMVTAGNDVINGEGGNDTIRAGTGNDTINGGAGDDWIYAYEGDDTLTGGAGNDVLNGWTGNDTAVFSADISEFAFVFVSADHVTIRHNPGTLGIDNAYYIETFRFNGTDYSRAALEAYAAGNNSDSTIPEDNGILTPVKIRMEWSGGFYTHTSTDDGTRTFYAAALGYTGATGAMVDLIRSGSSLTLDYKNVLAPGTVIVNGSADAETFTLSGVHNGLVARIYGYGGDDVITSTLVNGRETIRAGDGNDTVNAGGDVDWIYGDAGDDILNGEGGGDMIYGGTGNDTIDGGDGNDTLNGETGDDTIYGGDGNDTLYGVDGIDQLFGGAGNDTLRGGNQNDRLEGGDGYDKLYGDAGDDVLYGDANDDILDGGDGNDLIVDGSGRDTLWGRAGADTFGFTANGDGLDTIMDFSSVAGDKLNITDLLTGFTLGVDDISQFVRLTHQSTKTIVEVDSNGGANSFEQSFQIVGTSLAGNTAQNLLDSGILIVNQTLL